MVIPSPTIEEAVMSAGARGRVGKTLIAVGVVVGAACATVLGDLLGPLTFVPILGAVGCVTSGVALLGQ